MKNAIDYMFGAVGALLLLYYLILYRWYFFKLFLVTYSHLSIFKIQSSCLNYQFLLTTICILRQFHRKRTLQIF